MKRFKKHYSSFKCTIKDKSCKELFKCVIKSHSSPHEIALGAAIGLFLSAIPSFAFGMILAVYISYKKGYNLLATYIGTLLINPFNAPFIYYTEYKIGQLFLGQTKNLDLFNAWDTFTVDLFLSVAGELYLGAFVFSIICSIALYFITYFIIIEYRKVQKAYKDKHPS